MKYLLIVCFLMLSISAYAAVERRYLPKGKILTESPQGDDVLRVYVNEGYVTKLEFTEEVILVALGDDMLCHIELTENKKGVLIKPLDDIGQTNLLIDTQNKKHNYEIIVSDTSNVDYRIYTK